MSPARACLAAIAGLWGLTGLAGAASAQALPSSYTSASRYDAAGRLTGAIAPDPGTGVPVFAAVRNSYDGAGRLIRIETGRLSAWQGHAVAPAAWSGFIIHHTLEMSYDAAGRKLKEEFWANGARETVTQFSYDLAGRLECTAVRMNRAAFGSLPDSACALGAQGNEGPDRITRKVYDPAGQLTVEQRALGVTVGNGFPSTLQQDHARFEYSANGKRKAVIDANGNRAEMSWDSYDRQKSWIFPAKASSPPAPVNPDDYEEYDYDPNGNRTSLRKRDGVAIGFQYDALNRQTLKTVPASATGAAGYSVFYGYDLRGLQTHARFGSASGAGIANRYDGFGRLVSSTTTMDGVPRTFNSQYDADGNRTLLSSPSDYYAAFAYDGLGRMSAYKEGATTVVGFEYDPAGRRSALRFGAGATSSVGYGYDGVGRLDAMTRELAGTAADQVVGFTRNPASQVVTRTGSNDAYASNSARDVARPYAVNGLNQYTGAGGAAFEYDANGNLKSVATATDGSTAYVYDSENRLVSASGAWNATLAYDPLGRLWQISSAAGIKRFVYDGDRLVEEYDGAGNRPRTYVHGQGADELLVWYEWTGGPIHRFYHSDHQGSIIALADDDGNALAINTYDPWGIPKAGAVGNMGRFQYTGQQWIAELGLYYYKARLYSPGWGRFLQADPIGYDDQINLYAYVGNDPVNNTDPDGKCFENCPASYTSLEDSERVRQGDRIASGMVVTGLYEGTGLSSVITAINNPSAANVIMAAVAVSPGGRVTGPIYQAARGAQQVARRLGLSPVARATRDGRGIRFTARPGRPEGVRVMRGNPNSPNPAQQGPYVKVTDARGQSYGADGKVIEPTNLFPKPADNPAAHIAIDKFNPDRFKFR